MKKFIAVLLSLLFCFSFVACGGTNGDTTNPDVKEEFIGEWVNIGSDNNTPIVIEKKSDVKIEENTATVNGITYNIEIRNGITHLLSPDNPVFSDYVKTEYTTYTTVEITPDNWKDYFNISQISSVSRNSMGDVEFVTLGQYLIANDDIRKRIVRLDNDDIIGIEILYDKIPVAFEVDEDDNVILKPNAPVSIFESSKEYSVNEVVDINIDTLYDSGAKLLGDFPFLGTDIINTFENIKIIKTNGELKLYDNPLFE